MEGLRLRFHSRWSNGSGCIVGFTGECPWGAGWGEDTTDSQGGFGETSYWFLDNSLQRDIRIQYNHMGSWNELAVISNISGATPHQRNGNVSIFNLGILPTERFECPTVLVPVEDEGPGTPVISEVPDDSQGHVDTGKFHDPVIEEVPCGFGPNATFNGPDLSFDLTDVRHRDGQPTAPPERITWEVTVRNNGPVTYRGDSNCGTSVEAVFFIPELGQERTYNVALSGDIAPGATRVYTDDANLGEISEEASSSYNVVMTLDPAGIIPEANETNNVQPGCYTPATEVYVESPCASSLESAGDKPEMKGEYSKLRR